MKRTKKPAVKPQLAREWLRCYEEDGESPPHIAQAYHYDARTVRKQIELERQERERREARSIVLRRALEQHYADLCAFAQRLASQLTAEGGMLLPLRDDRMWSALREHLPRSVIWKSLDRWEHIQSRIGQLESEMAKSFEEQVKSRSPLNFAIPPQVIGLSKGMVSALAFNCKVIAQEQPGLLSMADFKLHQMERELTDIQLGAFDIGIVPNDQVPDIQKLVKELLDEVTTWNSYYELERLYIELKRTQGVLEDELAIITLRRVVPGKCIYCPF
jgi:hypothetical protein